MNDWADIWGFEGLYVIYKTGKIKSFLNGERWLKCSVDENGWRAVSLTKDGEVFYYKVHRLVAYHFIPNPNNYSGVGVVKYKDDCSVENVQWVENAQDRKAPRKFLIEHYENTKHGFYPMQKMLHKYFITQDISHIEYIFNRSYQKWLGHIIKITEYKPAAEDILHDCYEYFLDAINEGRFRIDRCYVDYAPDTFIFAIVRNQACNWLRRKREVLIDEFYYEGINEQQEDN